MFFRLLVIVLVVVGGYFSFEIVRFHSFSSQNTAGAPQYLVQEPQSKTKDEKITVVEFLDYNCSYCQTIHNSVQEVIKNNSNVEYIARPIPILGDASEQLVRLALAAGHLGNFWDFHHALMTFPAGHLTQKQIRSAAKAANLDFEKLSRLARSEKVTRDYQSNLKAAIDIDLDSTPTFLINEEVYVPEDGLIKSQDLQKAIDTLAR